MLHLNRPDLYFQPEFLRFVMALPADIREPVKRFAIEQEGNFWDDIDAFAGHHVDNYPSLSYLQIFRLYNISLRFGEETYSRILRLMLEFGD